MGDVQPAKQDINKIIKEESFYESTFDMDLVAKPASDNNHLDHQQLYSDLNNNVHKNPVILDTNANLYSEVPSKNSISKGSHIGELLNAASTTPPTAQINKKKPIANFFQKLAKTSTASDEIDIISVTSKANSNDKLDAHAAPEIPVKTFDPNQEFYNNHEFVEGALKDEDANIYFKIEKNDEIEGSEQETEEEAIEPNSLTALPLLPPQPPPSIPPPISTYTPIEPVDVNNHVYYAFSTSDEVKAVSHVSRVDVDCLNTHKLIFKIDSSRKATCLSDTPLGDTVKNRSGLTNNIQTKLSNRFGEPNQLIVKL